MAKIKEPSPLPAEAAHILQKLGAHPILVDHLRLVHAAAERIVAGLERHWPSLRFDRDAVLLGAAVHDVGKTQHPDEIHGPGSRHLEAGEALLLDLGVRRDVARMARSHGRWWREKADLPLEDLLVAIADQAWRGARESELEAEAAVRIARLVGEESWRVFGMLDGILDATQ